MPEHPTPPKALILPLVIGKGSHFTLQGSIPRAETLTLAVLDCRSGRPRVVGSCEGSAIGPELELTLSTDLSDGFAGGGVIDTMISDALPAVGGTPLAPYFALIAPGMLDEEALIELGQICQSPTRGMTSALPEGATLRVSGAGRLTVKGGYPWCNPDHYGRMAWAGFAPRTQRSAILIACKAEDQDKVRKITAKGPKRSRILVPDWQTEEGVAFAFFSDLDLGELEGERLEIWWGEAGVAKGLSFLPVQLKSEGESHDALFPKPLSRKVEITVPKTGPAQRKESQAYKGDAEGTNESTSCMLGERISSDGHEARQRQSNHRRSRRGHPENREDTLFNTEARFYNLPVDYQGPGIDPTKNLDTGQMALELEARVPSRYLRSQLPTKSTRSGDKINVSEAAFELAKQIQHPELWAPKSLRPKRTRSGTQKEHDWLLITADGPEGSQIQQALLPLIDHRQGECLTFETPTTHTPEGICYQVIQFLEQNHKVISQAEYILIAGDTRDLPFELYSQLSPHIKTGFLSLDDEEAYANYAQRVCHAEREGKAHKTPSGAATIFGPDRDDVQKLSCDHILSPLCEIIAKAHGTERVQARTRDQAILGHLLNDLSSEQSTSLFFAACHGRLDGTPQHPYTGALVDNHNAYFSARTVMEYGSLLNNGVAILNACASAGIPRSRKWAQLARKQVPSPEYDFVAALPRTWLGAKEGPLAVIGHLDILFTWGYSKRDGDMSGNPENNPGIDAFLELALQLMAGQTVGTAMKAMVDLASRYSDILSRMNWHVGVQDNDASARRRRLELLLQDFIRYHDLGGWIVYGDPMARLEGVAGPDRPKSTRSRGDIQLLSPQYTGRKLEQDIRSFIHRKL